MNAYQNPYQLIWARPILTNRFPARSMILLHTLGTQLSQTWHETYDKVLELAKEG